MKKYKSLLYIFNIGIALHSATPLAAFSFNMSYDTSSWQTPLGYYTPYVPIYEPIFLSMNGLSTLLFFTTQKIIENPKVAWASAGIIALGAYIYTKNLKTNLTTMTQEKNKLQTKNNELNQYYSTLQQKKNQQYQELQEKSNQLREAQETINSQNDILQQHDEGIDRTLARLTILKNQLCRQNYAKIKSLKRRHSDSNLDLTGYKKRTLKL